MVEDCRVPRISDARDALLITGARDSSACETQGGGALKSTAIEQTEITRRKGV
ncbi:hypothetical protein NDU88_002006, partial [Pleurodeles waltl]